MVHGNQWWRDNTTSYELQRFNESFTYYKVGIPTEEKLGTFTFIDDLLFISFGSQSSQIKSECDFINEKYELIRKYVCPIGYKIIHWKDGKKTIKPYNHTTVRTS